MHKKLWSHLCNIPVLQCGHIQGYNVVTTEEQHRPTQAKGRRVMVETIGSRRESQTGHDYRKEKKNEN